MFTSVRPRPAEPRPRFSPLPAPAARRGALIEAVTAGPGLAQAERLLLDLALDLARLFPGPTGRTLPSPTDPDAPGCVAKDFLPPNGRLLVARRGSEAIGVAGLCPLGAAGAAVISHLYVRPGHRGQGVARELLARAIGEARRLGYRELRLQAHPRMADALRLYRLAGFEPAETPSTHPAFPGTPLVAMSLALA